MKFILLILCVSVVHYVFAETNDSEVTDACLAAENPCKNGGICETKDKSYSCKCPINSGGENCEENAPLKDCAKFSGNGYLELNSSAFLDSSNISGVEALLSFSTHDPNGLLLWFGQKNGETYDGNDFMALAIVDGLLELTLRLDGKDGIIRTYDRIDDGKFHEVHVKRFLTFVTANVDDFFEGFIIDTNNARSYLPGNIFIGGTPNITTFTGNQYTKPFNGTIKSVEKFQWHVSLYQNQIYAPREFNNTVSGYNAVPCD